MDVNKQNTLLKVLLSLFMIFSSFLLVENYRYSTYRDVANICEYDCNEYGGNKIPSDVKVYFVKEVENLFRTKLGSIKIGFTTRGLYNPSSKIITILDEEETPEKYNEARNAFTLKHELAHDYYYYNMTDENKVTVHDWYNLVCENPNEFYAYVTQYYGDFVWLR